MEEFFKNHQYTVNAFTAIATFFAVFVSLWLARSPKIEIKTFFKLSRSSEKNEFDQIEIIFTNHGKIVAHIKEQWLLINLPFLYTQKMYIIIPNPSDSSSNSYFSISPNDPAQKLTFKFDLLFPSDLETIITQWSRWKKLYFEIIHHLNLINISIYMVDESSYKIKLQKGDRKYLLKFMRDKVRSNILIH